MVGKIPAWFKQLDDVEQIIIQDHVCAVNPASLDALASELHTFRHVVRRRRNDLPQSLQNVIEDDSDLQQAVACVEREIACPVIEADLISRHPWLAEEVTGDGVTVLDVLSGLKWPGSQVVGWIFDGDIEREQRRTLAALDMEVGETMTFKTARRLLEHDGVKITPGESTLCRWLACCGLAVSARQVILPAHGEFENEAERTALAVRTSRPEPGATPTPDLIPPAGNRREAHPTDDAAQPDTADTQPSYSQVTPAGGIDVLWTALERLRTLAVKHQVLADIKTLLRDADHLPGDMRRLAGQIRGASLGNDGRWHLGQAHASAGQLPASGVGGRAAPQDGLVRQIAPEKSDVGAIASSDRPEDTDATGAPAYDFTDPRPPCWLDVFPWLVSGSDVQTWWNDSVADSTSSIRRQRLTQVIEEAMARLTQWTIGQIFPRIAPEFPLNRLDLPSRAVTAFSQRHYSRVGHLVGVTVEEMSSWRQVGGGTVVAILRELGDASMLSALLMPDHHSIPRPPLQQQAAQSHFSQRTSNVVASLSEIATWYATVGLREQPLLGGSWVPGTPQDVVNTCRWLNALKAADVLTADEVELDVARLLDQALQTLDPRSVEILSARCFREVPYTLEQIGKDHGVSRERVRQIEGKARTAMRGLLGEGLLGRVAETTRSLIGTVRPLDDLLNMVPALGKVVDAVGLPAWRILNGLDDAYEIEDEWCAALTMTAAKTITETQLKEKADTYGVVRLDGISLIEASRPERLPELTESWLSRCGYVIDGGFVFTRTQSVNDYGAAVLSVAGTPLTAQEIVDRFAFRRSVGSLRNAMSQDDRFQRVDRDRWALSDWEMDAYAGVRTLIQEQVRRGGGQVLLNELIEYVTGKYRVTANSVVTYANSLPFENRDGVVRMAATDREIRKSPERTRRLFRHRDAWAYRVRITKDHLRGSGFPAPVAIAGIVGLQFGQARQLASPLGPQNISWTGNQPAFGSIRRFLLDSDITVGNEVFLIMTDDGRFALQPVQEPAGDDLADALSLIGIPDRLNGNEARKVLTQAIGLPSQSPMASVIGGYSERGDSDIAGLLMGARDVLESNEHPKFTGLSTDIDEVMDLL